MFKNLKDTFRSSAWRSILQWSKGQWFFIIILTVYTLITAVLGLYNTLCMKYIVDAAINGGKTGDFSGVLKYAIIMISIALFLVVSNYFMKLFQIYYETKLSNKMRRDMLKKILNKEFSSLDSYHSGELYTREFSDIDIVEKGILYTIPPIVGLIIQLIGGIIILFKQDWKFVVVVLGIIILAFLFVLCFRKKLKALHKKVQESNGKVNGSFQETLSNLSIVKASYIEERMIERIDESQKELLDDSFKRGKISTLGSSIMSFSYHACRLFALIWGCVGIFTGTLSYGTLVSTLSLVSMIRIDTSNIASVFMSFFNIVASAERLDEILHLPDEEKIDENVDSSNMYEVLKEIDFKNVTFSYGRDNENVIDKISFNIKPKDVTAITGLSGGGKTTLFLLLLGIYHPTTGKVNFEFSDTERVASSVTRRMFSYVPQGKMLFSGTIRENITMFTDKEVTDDEIKLAAERACILDFIEELPDKFETKIGERGLGLSEGQAQRLAIARAFLCDAPILLLDEATSALDELTEAKLLENISKIEDKTCLIVTHRKAALSICTKRLHFDDGIAKEVPLDFGMI